MIQKDVEYRAVKEPKCPYAGFVDCRDDCAMRGRDPVTGEDYGCCHSFLPAIEERLYTICEHLEQSK